jgi:NAD(P)H-hydrate repair Nnr-like enzyme with NAD(P)H-hydrate dehydratase domain
MSAPEVAVAVVDGGATRIFRSDEHGGAAEFAVVAAAFLPVDAVRLTTALLAFAAEASIVPASTVVDVKAKRLRGRPKAIPAKAKPEPKRAKTRRGKAPGAPSWMAQVVEYLSTRPDGATVAEIDAAIPRPDLRSTTAARVSAYRGTRRLIIRDGRVFLPPS